MFIAEYLYFTFWRRYPMTRTRIGDILWAAALAAITLFIALPTTHTLFMDATQAQPYLMGFVKLAILASMGELLALRLRTGAWKLPAGFVWRMLVWGLLGVAITFMFTFYANGVQALVGKGILPGLPAFGGILLSAFFTSLLMNATFGPVFMAVHRITDTYIDLRTGGSRPSMLTVLQTVDWTGFFSFVIGKTLPLFWLPAHTVTFALPANYRVLAAAYLSIVLGILLSLRRQKT